jgi:protein-S-isoprenylcysteine O-methyltransferase Ste14
MKLKQAINWHKGLTAPVIVAGMLLYQNFSLGAWVYLALHGTYGILWLLKDRIYPDKQWEQEMSLGMGGVTFTLLGLYWIAPFLLISSGKIPPLPLVAVAIALNLIGVFLHYASDAQKYYTLKYRAGLITEGFFARCRNTNYLGEICIYASFALLSLHWLPFVILAVFAIAVFVPNMLKKDRSLSRYPEFADYQAHSGLLFPSLFKQPTPAAEATPTSAAIEKIVSSTD